MNKRERLQATLEGQPVDRTPVALWRHFPVDDQRAEDLAIAHLEFQELYDFDFVKVTPASSFCLKDWGAQDEWRGHPQRTRDHQRPVSLQAPELQDPEPPGTQPRPFARHRRLLQTI